MSSLDFSDPEIKAKHRAFVNYLYEKYYGRNAINDNESEVELPRKIKKRGRPRKIENNATKTGLLNRGLLKGVKGVK